MPLFLRNALSEDYTALHQLFTSVNIQHFGRSRKKSNLADIFLNNYITHRILIQVSATNPHVIGYAEVSNAPNLPALSNDLWLDFIQFHYCCDLSLSVSNSCFLNTYVYNQHFNPEMLKQLLSEIFYRDNKLRYILIAECPDYKRYPEESHGNYYCLERYSTIYYPKCFSAISCKNTPKLHVIIRDDILPPMKYRRALPEDNDDIVEILDNDRPDLKERLGEYYIAEELLSNSSKSLLIVTEINHLSAGFIWLNDNVNLLNLLENYKLQPFGNLLKFNVNQRFKEKLLNVTTTQKRPLHKLFTMEMINQIYKTIGEVTNMENVSNLSLCSEYIEADEGRIVAVNEKRFVRELVLKKWEELNKNIKSYDYYIQLRKRQFGFYYNIPDGETHAPYDAQSNVFVIQLYGLMGSHDPRRIFRFLSTAFAAYPDKDYCLLTLGVTTNQMTSVLRVMLRYFIHVIPRPDCRLDEQLFITHRSAVFGDICLYLVRPNDLDNIKSLIKDDNPNAPFATKRTARSRVSTIADRVSYKSYLSLRNDSYAEETSYQYDLEQVLKILKNIFENPFSAYKCFTIRCGDACRSIDDNAMVGFVIVKPFHLSCYLNKHFHVYKEEEFLKFSQAEVVILKLHPFFHFQADFIFRELARLTSYTHFYYFRSTDQFYLSNDLVTFMQPFEPRRIKKLWFNYLRESSKISKTWNDNEIMDNFDLLNDHFAVFTNNLHPSTNFGNSSNIVILGFSDICKAFLRLMIFSWHNLSNNSQATSNCLPQLNITVICSPGVMEAEHEHAFKCQTCCRESGDTCWIDFRNSDAFIRDVFERMDVRNWIRFVSGKVESIDEVNQKIKMESDCEIPYETLLLMCGTDFGVPGRIFNDARTPPNYSHINNRLDKILFYHKLQILINDLPKNIKKSIVVYGSHIRAFEFVNFLLKHGLKGEEIHLVLPYSKMGLTLNNSAEDAGIEEILREMLEDMEVQIYEQLNLCSYSLHDDDENLKDVSFKKFIGGEVLKMECDLFVSFDEVFLAGPLLEIFKKPNLDTDSGFVLVNENYQTSVSNIYAMGNFIKHIVEPNHQYRFVSSQEAAEKIINILDLAQTEENVPPTPPLEKKFSKPSYFQAQLPNNYKFFKVTIPKRYLANHLDNEYGFPLITYNEGDFSRVRLNEHGIVEEIVIVTQKKINFDFLKFFCGRHESLLNNLKSRWYLKEIINFVDFFQEPWTELLMHEQFENLRMINKYLILNVAKDILKKDIDRYNRFKLLQTSCQDLGVSNQLEYALLEFLRQHREDFSNHIALPEDFPQNSEI